MASRSGWLRWREAGGDRLTLAGEFETFDGILNDTRDSIEADREAWKGITSGADADQDFVNQTEPDVPVEEAIRQL